MASNVFWTAAFCWVYYVFLGIEMKSSHGSAILSLKFLTFSNYHGLTDRRVCCDGQGSTACTSKCDHSFDVCVSSDRKESLRRLCPFGRIITGAITDKNYIQFGSTIGQSNNPLLFPIETWPPKLFLSVDIADKDSGALDHEDEDEDNTDDEVASLERMVIISPNNITKTILLQDRVQLSMEVRGFCAPNYYGLECGVYCYAYNSRGEESRYSCDENGRKRCHPGWAGQECDVNIDDCLSSPCSHSGTCTDLINGFRCECHSQYTGLTCETDVDECVTDTDACFNGTCVNEVGSHRCDCNPGFTGPRCLQDINECNQSPCLNGGVCSQSKKHGEFYCTCPANFTGRLCEENVNECTTTAHSQPICQHNGTCVDTFGSFYCHCSPFWTGEFCQENIDECAKQSEPPCSSIGTESCLNLDEGFGCVCFEGWSGALCGKDIDECKTVQDPCTNRGVCTNLNGSYKCDCQHGWKGDNCENDVDECGGSFDDVLAICENEGKCVNSPGAFSCQCSDFWSGEACSEDVDECVLGVCSTNSTKSCQNYPGGFSCVCNEGWTGITCGEDVDECEENSTVCDGYYSRLNGSKISELPDIGKGGNNDIEDKETSTSRARSTGDNRNHFTEEKNSWETTESPPLKNKSTRSNFVCSNSVPGYVCSCDVGWTGIRCDTVIEQQGYDEIDLPIEVLTPHPSQSSSSDGSLEWVVVVPLVLVMVVVYLAVVLYRRRNRRRKLSLDNRVTYVNEAFEDRTSTKARVNGFHNGNTSLPVEIPHLYLCGDEGETKPNQGGSTVLKEVVTSPDDSNLGNVDIHFHYEVPESEDEEVDEEDNNEPCNIRDDIIVRSVTEAPPTPAARQGSRSETAVTVSVDGNVDTTEEIPKETRVVNVDSGGVCMVEGAIDTVVENSYTNSEMVYVSRVDLILSQSHSTSEEIRYDHLPYIDATSTEPALQ